MGIKFEVLLLFIYHKQYIIRNVINYIYIYIYIVNNFLDYNLIYMYDSYYLNNYYINIHLL